MLYLGHFKQPLNSAFFDKLNNKFAYLAHDDGWYNKIYIKDKNDHIETLANLLPYKLKPYRKKAVRRLNHDVAEQILEFAKDGILIDLYRTIKLRSSIEIPLNIIGQIGDFDDVYNNMERYKSKAKREYWLIYKKNQWIIKSYQ